MAASLPCLRLLWSLTSIMWKVFPSITFSPAVFTSSIVMVMSSLLRRPNLIQAATIKEFLTWRTSSSLNIYNSVVGVFPTSSKCLSISTSISSKSPASTIRSFDLFLVPTWSSPLFFHSDSYVAVISWPKYSIFTFLAICSATVSSWFLSGIQQEFYWRTTAGIRNFTSLSNIVLYFTFDLAVIPGWCLKVSNSSLIDFPSEICAKVRGEHFFLEG